MLASGAAQLPRREEAMQQGPTSITHRRTTSIASARTGSSAYSLMELLVVIGIVAVLASTLLPAVTIVRGAARASICASSMRQLGLAVVGYALDNDGQIPPSRLANCAPAEMGFTAGSTVTWYHPLLVGAYIGSNRVITEDGIPGVGPYPAPLRCPEDRIRKGSSTSNGVSYGLNREISPFADNAGQLLGPNGVWAKIASLHLLRLSRKSSIVLLLETHEARCHPYNGGGSAWPNCPLYPQNAQTSWVGWPTPNNIFARHRNGTNLVFLDGHAGWCSSLTAELTSRNFSLGRTDDNP